MTRTLRRLLAVVGSGMLTGLGIRSLAQPPPAPPPHSTVKAAASQLATAQAQVRRWQAAVSRLQRTQRAVLAEAATLQRHVQATAQAIKVLQAARPPSPPTAPPPSVLGVSPSPLARLTPGPPPAVHSLTGASGHLDDELRARDDPDAGAIPDDRAGPTHGTRTMEATAYDQDAR